MDHEILIGKYTLESLTNGMYASPMDLYREYIQNAVDSFDEAIHSGIEKESSLRISITIDEEGRNLLISDNGCGIICDKAMPTLIDIGNSSKVRSYTRGFRGIGRLAGLGYCDQLVFSTSAIGEDKRTIVEFDAKMLRNLMLSNDQKNISVADVMRRIITSSVQYEKPERHYFEVMLKGVTSVDGLLSSEKVEKYLTQNAPIPFDKSFTWRSTILEKLRLAGCDVSSYRILLNGKELYKPYRDTFESDRAKKTLDSIQDINIERYLIDGKLCAVLWFAKTNYNGTVNDPAIKGIRIRQGNILIGDRMTCNSFFKEERFNGWLIGELHVLDPNLIANSRRDGFEKNETFYSLAGSLKEWASSISKEIRKISYERSLSKERKAIIDADEIDDVNELCFEDLSFAEEITESDYIDESDSDSLAHSDYFEKLYLLLDKKRAQTKYTALNINQKLSMEQRKVLERVFDLIQAEYCEDEAKRFIELIASKY